MINTKKPANKSDIFSSYEDAEKNLQELRDEFEPKGIKVMTISAATGDGVKELLKEASDLLKTLPDKVTTFEQEYDPQISLKIQDDPYTVYYDDEEEDLYCTHFFEFNGVENKIKPYKYSVDRIYELRRVNFIKFNEANKIAYSSKNNLYIENI